MPAAPRRSVYVWSPFVRLVHWCVAALVVFNLFNDAGGRMHRFAGYAAAAFVVVRGLHAVLRRGTPSGWHVPTPRACLAHARAMFRGRPPRVDGHNPLGAAMAILLWGLVVALALTGWISRWDRFWGEDWPVDLHGGLSIALQVAVLLHLAGVLASSVLEKRNLAAAMITGRKRVD